MPVPGTITCGFIFALKLFRIETKNNGLPDIQAVSLNPLGTVLNSCPVLLSVTELPVQGTAERPRACIVCMKPGGP